MIQDKLSIYVPLSKRASRPIERLQKIAKKQDRSINYLVIQALSEYLEREENKATRKSKR
jgi:predicted transcriptional regulator